MTVAGADSQKQRGQTAEDEREAIDDARELSAWLNAGAHIGDAPKWLGRWPSQALTARLFRALLDERERLADTLQAIIDQDTRPFVSWAEYVVFIRDIARNALDPHTGKNS